MNDARPFLSMEGIVKRFPGGVVANDRVTLSVERGEIHGLLGENGAGKSTLMNILYGLYTPDVGEVWFRGERLRAHSPQDAIDAGIGMVHQHFKLVPRLSVLENVVLGLRESDYARVEAPEFLRSMLRSFTLGLSTSRSRVAALSAEYGIDVDPDADVWELSVGEQQRVELLKALYRDVDLLVLDEPTAVLAPQEADTLFATLRRLAADGLTVIFITHKLEEATSVTDRITVLRDGTVVDTVDTDATTRAELAEMMVGREVAPTVDRKSVPVDGVVMSATDLHTVDDRGVEALRGVSLDLRAGEVVGVAGVSGNGQEELAECLVGVRPVTGGTIVVDGADLTGRSVRRFVESGVSYIPADRLRDGCAPALDVTTNACMKDYRRFVRHGFLAYDDLDAYAADIVETFDVRAPARSVPAGTLSGGNLQKLIIGRELSRNPTVLVANQPIRGLDVGAIDYVERALLSQRSEGTATLLIADDLDAVLALSDRVQVLYEGEFVHETDVDAADRTRIGEYMTGRRAASGAVDG